MGWMSLCREGGGDGQRTWVMIPQAGKGAMGDLGRNTRLTLISASAFVAIQYHDLL